MFISTTENNSPIEVDEKIQEIQNFTIDFFEFTFLVEACIPPKPIARTMFWHKVINVFFYDLTRKQRTNLYNFIKINEKFKESVSKGNKDCSIFLYRFDPENQYKIFTDDGIFVAFKYNNKFHIYIDTYIDENHIKKIEKYENV